MSTNAHGRDFWIGLVFHSKDTREFWRHVVITDIKNGKAKCNRLTEPFSDKKMLTRGSMISLKALASSRWETCVESRPCSYCKPQEVTAT